jgi:octaprenyl-diphosphate synthase
MRDLKQKIFAEVGRDLEQIETALKENLTPYLDIVRQTASHLLFSGGKRLRPLLTVLCARLCGYSGSYDKIFSVIFEYIHAATLLHDDVVDGANLRRGKSAAYMIFGAPAAVLSGDFLMARALSIAAETGRMNVIRVIARITENMSQGEIHQLIKKGDINLSEAEYAEVIRRKTAVLIQGACQSGAMISDADDSREKALSEYGFHLGMAFQMADDLLDYVSDTETLGKNIGSDLREGKLTLPVIYALKRATPEDRTFMETLIHHKSFSDDDFENLKNLLRTYQGIAYTEKTAQDHVEKAKSALSIFESSKTKETLSDIADYALYRKS